MLTKVCKYCLEEKELDSLIKNHKTTQDYNTGKGFYRHCRECQLERRKVLRKKYTLHNRQYTYNYGRTVKGKYNTLKASAKARKIKMCISLQEYEDIVTNASCYYCGGCLPETGSGLDRKDFASPYTVGNVVPCCHVCNIMKGKLGKVDFVLHCSKVHKFIHEEV